MKRILALTAGLFLGAVVFAGPAYADASAPTNGGSANGGGQSGQCTGDMASRPPSCHNDTGNDGN